MPSRGRATGSPDSSRWLCRWSRGNRCGSYAARSLHKRRSGPLVVAVLAVRRAVAAVLVLPQCREGALFGGVVGFGERGVLGGGVGEQEAARAGGAAGAQFVHFDGHRGALVFQRHGVAVVVDGP